ncbi:MAG: cyclic nucleotide-binding domain-containing protein [Verrucomicrobia bacterium]|nr:cyclic nucleotide-binding domain-containing protein [Verrucomicrobiota bacterium]
MPVHVRQAKSTDADKWLDLVRATLGENHPARHVYDPKWIAAQLDPSAGNETWVAESDDVLLATLSVLNPVAAVGNLGRNLFREESFSNGAADALLRRVLTRCEQNNQMVVARLLASDNAQQALFEKHGCVCIGFQPLKHVLKAREEVLFYIKPSRERLSHRVPISESLPQISELAAASLANLQIPGSLSVRDGATGYPIHTEVTFHDASHAEYDTLFKSAESSHPPVEISGGFNWGFGFMRVETREAPRDNLYRVSRDTGFMRLEAASIPLRVVLAMRGGDTVAGLEFYFDDVDRCVRVVNGFSTDDLSMGALLNHVAQVAQGPLNAAYVEVDILTTAPRLLKSAEQLGFVPVAYLPAFHAREDTHTDVVKMVKLNLVYTLQNNTLTSHARSIVKIIEHALEDLKTGVALINLLRGLAFFDGLGDGELRKIARLFTQALFRPGEKVFGKDDPGHEAFVVMRGQVKICLAEDASPIAVIGQGQIFGEQAFLDGAKRGAMAVAEQASILLVMQRTAFQELSQREPHLGMAVMRNIALELSKKLRRTNVALTTAK